MTSSRIFSWSFLIGYFIDQLKCKLGGARKNPLSLFFDIARNEEKRVLILRHHIQSIDWLLTRSWCSTLNPHTGSKSQSFIQKYGNRDPSRCLSSGKMLLLSNLLSLWPVPGLATRRRSVLQGDYLASFGDLIEFNWSRCCVISTHLQVNKTESFGLKTIQPGHLSIFAFFQRNCLHRWTHRSRGNYRDPQLTDWRREEIQILYDKEM